MMVVLVTDGDVGEVVPVMMVADGAAGGGWYL